MILAGFVRSTVRLKLVKSLLYKYDLQYEEGRETFGVLICVAWMKMTSHVSRSQVTS